MIIVFIIFLFILKKLDVYVFAIELNCLSFLLMHFTCALYIFKMFNYKYDIGLDYTIFTFISRFNVHLDEIKVIGNVSVCIFAFSSLYLTRFVMEWKSRKIYLFWIAMSVFFLYTNSPKFCWYMYMTSNSELENAVQMSRLNVIIQSINKTLLIAICAIPLVSIVIKYRKSKIHTIKVKLLVYFISLIIQYIYVIFVFIKGEFSAFMFYNIDGAGIPNMSDIEYDYMNVAMITFTMMMLIIFMMIVFKPYNVIVCSRKKLNENSFFFNKNLGILMHTYKNAFLSINKKAELSLYMKQIGKGELSDKYLHDVLDTSKLYIDRVSRILNLVKSKNFDVECIDLKESIIKAVNCSFIEDSIEVNADNLYDNVFILADSECITEIFVNLIRNSCESISKKGIPKGEICISMYREWNTVGINVYDNGLGIPRGEIKKIFRQFYSSKKPAECGGVGLEYVKRMVNIFGGDVYVESKEGEYAMFQVSFPLKVKLRI